MLHYQVVRTSPGGATLSNKMNNTVHYGHVRHTLALMCAKNHLLTFSSFLDIWENVEWPRFFWTTLYIGDMYRIYIQYFPVRKYWIFSIIVKNWILQHYFIT